MSGIDDPAVTRRARGQIARRRGALIGLILIGLGVWGALVPFIGPYFHYAYTPDHAWRWTASRGWLEVLPGAVIALGGLLVLTSNRRATAVLGAWLAAAGGAWFAVGTSFAPIVHTGSVGTPAGSTATLRALEAIGFFYGLGVVIVFFAATASGRLSVRSLADIHLAQRELNQELDATTRARQRDADATDVRPRIEAGERPRRSHQQPDQSEWVPAVIGQPSAAATGARSTTETSGPAGPEGFPGGGATAVAGIDRRDDQPDSRRARRSTPLDRNS